VGYKVCWLRTKNTSRLQDAVVAPRSKNLAFQVCVPCLLIGKFIVFSWVGELAQFFFEHTLPLSVARQIFRY